MKQSLISFAALLMAALMIVTGCGQSAQQPVSEAEPAPVQEPVAVDTLNVCIGGEPRTLDPTLYSTAAEASYIVQLFEGLTTVASDGRVTAAAARLWTVQDSDFGQPVYTFTLREDALWSDGTPVKAEDFIYSWRRAADPANASPYGYLMAAIKGGAAILAGEAEADTLGVQADEEGRLIVTLEGPCQYFTQLLTLPVFFPLREDIVSDNPLGWSASADSCIGNGAYTLSDWKHDDKIELLRNDKHYNADAVSVRELTCCIYDYIDRAQAALNSGEIDYLAADAAPAAVSAEQSEETQSDAGSSSSGNDAEQDAAQGTLKTGTNNLAESYYFVTNRKSGPMLNYKFARALSLALERSALIEGLDISADYLPATGLIPDGMTTTYTKQDFRELAGNPMQTMTEEGEDDLAAAKRYLREAGFGDGSNAPELSLITNDTDAQISIAYAASEIWEQTLGIYVRVEALNYEDFIERRLSGDFDIARGGAVAVCEDPELILDQFCSEYSGGWFSNEAYDTLMTSARLEQTSSIRSRLLAEAEEMLISQGVVIPMMFRHASTYSREGIEGIVTTGTGISYLMYARHYVPAQ